MNAPFVLKISFYQPSPTNAEKNSKHVKYIGTRPGVNLEKKPLEQELSPDSAAGHVKYAGERPGSHGLFSANEQGPININHVQEELLNHKGNVWRMILSLREDDAAELGFLSRKAWEDLVRSSVNDVAREMGISSSNVKWVAAFHEEKGHPHVHLVLWEKEPKRGKGVLSAGEHKNVRRIFTREIYKEEKHRLNLIKTAERDHIREFARESISQTVRLMKESGDDLIFRFDEIENGVHQMNPKIHTSDVRLLHEKIRELAGVLPEKGRVTYAMMPEPVKHQVRGIASWLINLPQFRDSLDQYLKSVEGLTRMNVIDQEKVDAAKQRALDDLVKRVSQVILKGALESKNEFSPTIDKQKANKALQAFQNANKGPLKENMGLLVAKKAIEVLKGHDFSLDEIKHIFKQWQQKAELGISQKDLEDALGMPAKEIDHQETKLVAAGLLKLAGYDENRIPDRVRDLGREEIKGLFRQVEKKTNTFFISEKLWTELSNTLGKKAAYPYTSTETSELNISKTELIDHFKNSRFTVLDKSERSVGWTAFCMLVAMKQANMPRSERNSVILHWLNENQLPRINFEKMNDKIEESSNFIRENTWQKITANLGIDLKYPFVSEQELSFDFKKAQEAIDLFREVQPAESIKEKIADIYCRLIRNYYFNDIDAFKQEFAEWAKRIGLEAEKINGLLQQYEKRTGDIEFLRKNFAIKDNHQEILKNYSVVLFAAGLEKEKVTEVIRNWNHKIGNLYDNSAIEKTIEQVAKMHTENQLWGKTTFISKERYKELISTLGVKPPYFYKFPNMGQPSSLSNSIWKAVWKEIEKERVASDIQAKRRLRARLRKERANQRNREH